MVDSYPDIAIMRRLDTQTCLVKQFGVGLEKGSIVPI